VSFAYEFSKRALNQFQQIEPWLAEEILDELESLLSQPPLSGPNSPLGIVHDFVRQRGDQTFYVFLTVKTVRGKELLRVTTVGIHVR
jgi:hypothetical protein